jgi:ferredoxin-NADP reductase
MNSTCRTWLLRLHRWTGLTVGVVIVVIAVTGAAIAFRPQLEPMLNRELLTVPACIGRVPLDTLTANAVAAHPGATLDYLRLLAGDDAEPRLPAAMVRFTDQTMVYLNPCTGAVLGQRHRYGGMLGTIEQIHRFRFMPHGSLLTGACALLFGGLLIVGGLCLWLPAALGGIRGALRFNARLRGPARTISQHKTVGLYASAIVLASVLTGLPQALNWYKAGLYALTGSAQPARHALSAEPGGAPRLTLEALWERAHKLVPRPQEVLIHYPDRQRAAVNMYLIARGAPHVNARTMLQLDAYSGKVLGFTPYAASSAGHKLYFWTLSLHTGHIGGPAGQLLLMLGALSVPVLAYTGIGGYLRRRRHASTAGRMTVRVARKTTEAQGICSFELVDLAGGVLPRFCAGAHLDVYLRDGSTRQYSLCNDPRETHRYLICVQREANSRGGSRALHDELRQGQRIDIGAPKARFALDPGAGRSLLIAGGIGITPLISMAEQLARTGADFTLHYCTRSMQRTAFLARLRSAPFAERVLFHFSDGPPGQLADFAQLLKGPAPDTHLYVCGPTGFLNVVCDTARAAGWSAAQLHKEYFSAESRKSDADTAFDIKLAASGKVLHVPSDRSALEVMCAAGIDIARSCEQGVCGTCLTRVLAGVPEHRDLYQTDAERNSNTQFTPCCSRARGPVLVLDL